MSRLIPDWLDGEAEAVLAANEARTTARVAVSVSILSIEFGSAGNERGEVWGERTLNSYGHNQEIQYLSLMRTTPSPAPTPPQGDPVHPERLAPPEVSDSGHLELFRLQSSTCDLRRGRVKKYGAKPRARP